MASQLKNTHTFSAIPATSTVAWAHGLNWDGVNKTPDVGFADNAFVTFSADETYVYATNNALTVQTVGLLVESWHTFERSFGAAQTTSLAPQPLFFYVGAAGSAAQGSYIEISGQQSVAGNVVPVDATYDYYIQSDLGAVFVGPVATYGSDSNPGTKDLPFLTTQGAIQHAVRQGVQGAQIRLHYGGYSVRPDGGWPTSPVATNDPWDGYPTERRRYTQRDIRLTGTEAFKAAYSFLGPRKMFPSTPVLTYLGATQVGQRVRLDFVENVFGVGAIGTYIGLRRIDDDRDIFFPHVISEVIAANSIMVEPPFSAAAWDAVYAAQNGYFPRICHGGRNFW